MLRTALLAQLAEDTCSLELGLHRATHAEGAHPIQHSTPQLQHPLHARVITAIPMSLAFPIDLWGACAAACATRGGFVSSGLKRADAASRLQRSGLYRAPARLSPSPLKSICG